MPGDRHRRRRARDDRAHGAGDDPLASEPRRSAAAEAVGVSGADVRDGASRQARRAPRSAGSALPLPKATATADRRDRRHGLPHQSPTAMFQALRRRRAVAVRARRRRRGRDARPTSSSMSATITIAKARAPPATPAAPAARGATAGTRGRPTSSSRRAACSPPRRGSSCAATTNRATARGRAGGASSIRGRSRRGRTATRRPTTTSATTATPYAVPLGSGADTQFLVFDSSNVGVDAASPVRPHVPQLPERSWSTRSRSARARRSAFFMSHHPVLGFAANPGKPAVTVPGQRGSAIGAAGAVLRRAVPAERRGAALRAQSPVRVRELRVAASAAVHLRQRRRLAGRAVPGAVSARPATRARAPWSPSSSPTAASAS